MDNSSVPIMEKTEDYLGTDTVNSKEVVKSSDHSPTRTSVKSVKTASAAKNNRFGGGKFPIKAGKSNTSLAGNVNEKDSSMAQSRKTIPPTTKKSPSSKIPGSIKKSTLYNTKAIVEHKALEVKRDVQKTVRQKQQPEKKQIDLKEKRISRPNLVAGIKKSEQQPDDVIKSVSTAKSSSVTAAAISNQLETITKCQSARSRSVSSVSCQNRNASTISLSGTDYSKMGTENETNLRKILSIAGDFNKSEDIDKEINHEPNEKLPKEKTESVKSAPSIFEFKSKIKTFMDQWFSTLKHEMKDVNNVNDCDVEQLQILKCNDILSFIDDWCASAKELDVNKEVEDVNRSFTILEKKYNDLVMQHEKERLKLEKDLAEKAEADAVKTDEHIEEFQKKIEMQEKHINTLKTTVQNLEKEKEHMLSDNNNLQDELKHCKDCHTTTNKKLQDIEQQLTQEQKDLKTKNELIKKLENDLIAKNKLETELNEMTRKLEELQDKLNQKSHNECVEHLKTISELTNQVSCLESNKEGLQQCNEKLQQEINDLAQVREKIKETEKKLLDLQAECEEKEKATVNAPDNSKDVQVELAKYRQSEDEKRREIEKLKTELSKTQFNICQLEQQVQRDQQLLEVRSGLINSLQTNEKTHRIHIEELFAQLSEKNSAVNELNSELQAKSEEFRNLFTTLSAKQVEVANQEHIIKLLEESNERSQMLRVKQEEKIGRLEEELAHLKHTIAMHQANILAGNSGRNSLYPPAVLPSKHMDYNENFYYYVSQRKRKRHVDINVKKYEA